MWPLCPAWERDWESRRAREREGKERNEKEEVWLWKEVLKTKCEGITLAGWVVWGIGGGGGGCRAQQLGSGLQMWISEQR